VITAVGGDWGGFPRPLFASGGIVASCGREAADAPARDPITRNHPVATIETLPREVYDRFADRRVFPVDPRPDHLTASPTRSDAVEESFRWRAGIGPAPWCEYLPGA
jgi:hypothetical protein